MDREFDYSYNVNEIEQFHFAVLSKFDIENILLDEIYKQFVYFGDIVLNENYLSEGVIVDANLSYSEPLAVTLVNVM